MLLLVYVMPYFEVHYYSIERLYFRLGLLPIKCYIQFVYVHCILPLSENEPLKEDFVISMSKEKGNIYIASVKTECGVLQLKFRLNTMQKLKDLRREDL